MQHPLNGTEQKSSTKALSIINIFCLHFSNKCFRTRDPFELISLVEQYFSRAVRVGKDKKLNKFSKENFLSVSFCSREQNKCSRERKF